jgi:hypothetical protein
LLSSQAYVPFIQKQLLIYSILDILNMLEKIDFCLTKAGQCYFLPPVNRLPSPLSLPPTVLRISHRTPPSAFVVLLAAAPADRPDYITAFVEEINC